MVALEVSRVERQAQLGAMLAQHVVVQDPNLMHGNPLIQVVRVLRLEVFQIWVVRDLSLKIVQSWVVRDLRLVVVHTWVVRDLRQVFVQSLVV